MVKEIVPVSMNVEARSMTHQQDCTTTAQENVCVSAIHLVSRLYRGYTEWNNSSDP